MVPDRYLHLAAVFLGFFLKVALAFALCLLLQRLTSAPRRKFAIWLGFMLGSLACWIYLVISFFAFAAPSGPAIGAISYLPSKLAHSFWVPLKFQHSAVIWGRGLGWLYGLVVALLLASGFWSRIRLHYLLRFGAQPSQELKNLFSEMCRHFGVRGCELLVLSKVSSPATLYWWRPRIVLPEVCVQLGDSAPMVDILCHELAHVARRDYFWSSLNDLICRILFFHPAVWRAKKEMRVYREMACDLAVVAARPEHRADYAHTLTKVARLCFARRYPVIGIDFAASAPSLLAHRIHAILNGPERSSWGKRIYRAAAGVALVGAYAVVCLRVGVALAFEPAAQPPAQTRQVHPPEKMQTHVVSRRQTAKFQAAEAGTELVTESPAYRFKSSLDSGSRSLEPMSLDPQGSNMDSMGFAGYSGVRRAGSPGAAQTVESIIVTAVGTIVGEDRDDRSKHKEGHFTTTRERL